MLDMWNGELKFTIDGRDCGTASKDKRLKQGKYYAAILLMSKEDKVTLVNPRKLSQAAAGYRSLFSQLGVEAEENPRFYKLAEEVQEYFTDMTQEKALHKLMLGAYLNNMDSFELLSQRVCASEARQGGPGLALTQSQISSLGAQTQKGAIPASPETLSSCYILKKLIYSFMNPVLVPYRDFHEEYRLAAFESFIQRTTAEIMNLHFMLTDAENQFTAGAAASKPSAPQAKAAPAQAPKEAEKPAKGGMFGSKKKSQATAPEKEEDPKEEEPPQEEEASGETPATKPAEVIQVEVDALSLQVHTKFNSWPMPKMNMALEAEALQSNESLFKLKLLDFTEKLLAMSAVEFDKICIGRIDR